MAEFFEIAAWLLIVFGGFATLIKLIDLEASRRVLKHRHGRVRNFAEVGLDLRVSLSCLVGGIALLAYRWKLGSAGWWLTRVPLIVVGLAALQGIVRDLLRRRTGRTKPEPS